MDKALLQTRSLHRSFGGVHAVKDVTFHVPDGAIKAVIGPNGAGKTTLFNLIAGAISPHGGEVLFRDKPITGWKPHAIASLGIARTFQTTKLFPHMTVLENIMVGRHSRMRSGFVAALLNLPGTWRETREAQAKAHAILDDLGLSAHAGEIAANLSFGRQRLVEFARALAMEPTLLLLDEPAAGLSSAETHTLTLLLKKLDPSITILLIEHDMDVAFEFAERITVLYQGKLLTEGTKEEIKNNPTVQEIYLGGE